jgi:hypothetical protein
VSICKQMNDVFLIASIAFTLTILFGCGKPVTRSELVGTYIADYSAAKETLELRSDGEFVQKVEIKSDHKLIQTNGAWTFDSTPMQITFHNNFISVFDGFGGPRNHPKAVTFVFPIVSAFGSIRIGDDPTIIYRKLR